MTTLPPDYTPLRIRAESSEDIAALSSLCQDTITSAGQLRFDASARQFVLLGNRYCWEMDGRTRRWFNPRPQPMRVRSAVRFAYVDKAQFRGSDLSDDDAPLNLLAITDGSSGEAAKLTLHFSQTLEISLTCEVIDITLDDLSPPWLVQSRPRHD